MKSLIKFTLAALMCALVCIAASCVPGAPGDSPAPANNTPTAQPSAAADPETEPPEPTPYINYTEPTEQQLDDFAAMAVTSVNLFGEFSDASTIPVTKLVKYYYEVLEHSDMCSDNAFKYPEVWESTPKDMYAMLVHSIGEDELRDWFAKRLGVKPVFTDIKDTPMASYKNDDGSYIITANYFSDEHKVSFKIDGWMGAGFSSDIFRPYLEYNGYEKDANTFVFTVVLVTKEQPADTEGIRTAEIVEAGNEWDGVWFFYDVYEAMSDSQKEFWFEGLEVTRSTVYYVPKYDLIAEHIDGEFCLKAIRGR